jgi:lipopolysaccharide/colanic/teichoic acid biosynthesis glycosyltransferase
VTLQDNRSIDGANSGNALTNIMPALRLGNAAKRLADVAVAKISLILFSPLLLIAYVAIRLDSTGPVVVRVRRYGYKNRPIQVLQFRLVETSAEADRSRSRLTRVGRILSQTGIDELPRLVNVLRGEMSIFGPPPSTHPDASLNWTKPGMIRRWAQIIATKDTDQD